MTKILLKVCIYLFISTCIMENISAEDENDEYSIAYTSETFVEEVPKNNHFVMFYAPWFVLFNFNFKDQFDFQCINSSDYS